MASLSEKAALLISANTLKYAVGFVLPMALVRLLTKEEYGTYLQLTLISNLGVGLMALGLPTSVYYFYARKAHIPHGRATLIAQTQVLLLAAALVSSLCVAFGAPLIGKWMNNDQLTTLLPIYAAYVGVTLAGEHFLHVMISQNRYGMAVALEAGETVLRVSFLLVPVAWGLGLHGIAWALLIFGVVRIAVRSFWLWRGEESILRARWSLRFPAEQLMYSMPLALSSYVATIGGLLDRAIVAVWFTPAAYAVYSVGALEIPLDVIFQASVANVLRASLPELVRDGRTAEIIRIWRESVRKLAIIVVPSFVFLMTFAETFITVLFTESYAESTQVFRIYLLLIPLHMFILSAIPQVYGKTRLNLYVVITVTAVNVLLSLVLLRFVGILGPAMSLIVSSYIGSAIYFVATMRLIGAGAAQLLPISPILRTLLAASIAVAPAYGVFALFSPGIVALGLAGLAYGATFALGGYLVGVFQEQDINVARAWLKRMAARREA